MADRRVLVVDDNVPLRRALERALSRAGWDPVLVGSVEDALVVLASDPPAVVLTDYDLPDGAGVDVVRRAAASGALSIVMSGDPSAAVVAEVAAAGATAVLGKPFEFPELLALLPDG